MLGLAALAVFLSGPAQTYGVSVFIDPILNEFGWSRSLVAGMYALATLSSAIPLVIVGRQIDRVGSRAVLTGAAVLFGLALLGLSLVSTPVGLLVGFAVLRTCGSGALTLAARTLVPQWFVRRRGRAFSIVGIASALSLAAIPRVNEALIGWVGWRDAWRLLAVVVLLGLVPALALLVRNRPEDIGQFPDGLPPEAPLSEAAQEAAADGEWTLREASRTRAFWAVLFAGVVPSLVVTRVSFHQISIMTARGLPTSLAATTFAVESAVALPLTLAAGWLADRYPTRFILSAAQMFLLVALLVLTGADSAGIVLIYSALRGAAAGLWGVAADVAWTAYFGRRHLGSIRGVTFAAGIVGAAIGPVPLGLAFDRTGSYNPAIIAYMALPAIAMIFVLFARPPRKASSASPT
jgi:MFS family permease